MATIPFVIDGNLGKLSDKLIEIINNYDVFIAGVRSLIMIGMDQYHQNTCIRFVERTDEYDYIHISKENGYEI